VEFQVNEEGIKAINEWFEKKIVALQDKEAALQSEVITPQRTSTIFKPNFGASLTSAWYSLRTRRMPDR